MLGKFENNLSQIKDNVKAEIIKVHNANLNDLESGMYHYLTTFASNPCRLQINYYPRVSFVGHFASWLGII